MWWIRASIQEFILRSWSLVKMGTTAAQKKLFFNLRRMKNNLEAFEDGDLSPEHLTKIATDLGVTEEEVTSMNRRIDRKSTRLNLQSLMRISYAVFCLKKKNLNYFILTHSLIIINHFIHDIFFYISLTMLIIYLIYHIF